jgi:hypothetical protein
LKKTEGHRKTSLCPKSSHQKKAWVLLFLFVVSLIPAGVAGPFVGKAQTVATTAPSAGSDVFRLERVPIDGGAELVTIHAKLSGVDPSIAWNDPWVPMVTVLRDTLGDAIPENDRLRYVWPLTYTRPSLRQRIFGAIPFVYTTVGSKDKTGKAPPPVLDLAAPDRDVWNRIFWVALQSLLLDPYGAPVKASTRSYRQNIADYRKSHVVRALAVLTLYQEVAGSEQSAFTKSELAEIQGRLLLTDKTFGGLVENLQLARYAEKNLTSVHDERGHNWDLLRQRAEAESLYFEPLHMPDGSPTHVVLWVAKEDLVTRKNQHFVKRFLNIDSPWSDKRLTRWKGYVETRYFDAQSRPASPDEPGARAVEMIPLALYGLDHPKIPVLLVDFRDGLNPKKREMSRRVLQDVTRNVLSLSKFGDVPYFLGRTVFDFVTGRRGMDINQPSRLRTYSELKLLLSLNQSLDPDLRDEIGDRVEKVSLNPFQNDFEAEAKLARQQYAALVASAKSPDGLPARLNRDRRAELVAREHGKVERAVFRIGNILSFGNYTHREKNNPEVIERLDIARRLKFHSRFLRQVAQSSPQIDVLWNLDDVKTALRFIAEHGSEADSRAIRATAEIFNRTQDDDIRRTCLESLARIDKPKARKELLRISQTEGLSATWKELISSYLSETKLAEPLASTGAKTRAGASGQQ